MSQMLDAKPVLAIDPAHPSLWLVRVGDRTFGPLNKSRAVELLKLLTGAALRSAQENAGRASAGPGRRSVAKGDRP
jgi:hypothetical protein